MQHFSAAHIDTHMGNARCIVSADEKDQVAGSCVGRGYRGGNIVESLGSQPARIADAALRQHPGHESGTIKRSVWIAAAPDIGIADILLRFGNERCKGFIFQCGRRNTPLCVAQSTIFSFSIGSLCRWKIFLKIFTETLPKPRLPFGIEAKGEESRPLGA